MVRSQRHGCEQWNPERGLKPRGDLAVRGIERMWVVLSRFNVAALPYLECSANDGTDTASNP